MMFIFSTKNIERETKLIAAWVKDLKFNLGPSINGLVTDENIKLCCRGSVLALFQSTAACKIDSKHTQSFTKLFPVCTVEI